MTEATYETIARDTQHRRLGRALAWFTIVILAVSPIPLGSTPPLSNALWGMLIALASAAWLAFGPKNHARFIPWSLGAAYAALCLYLLVQIIPFGTLSGGFAVPISDGSTIRFATLSIAPGDTTLMLVRLLSYGLLFWLVSQLAADDGARHLMLRAIVVVVTAHAFFGIVALYQLGDTILGAPKWNYHGTATGTFINRNSYATYLSIGLAVSTTLAARALLPRPAGAPRASGDPNGLLYLAAALVLVITIVLTNSRAGLVVALLGMAIVVLAAIAENRRLLRPMLMVFPALLAGFAALFMVYGENIWRRFEDSAANLDFRFQLYQQVLELISRRPLLGFGGGTFEQAFPIVHDKALANHLTWDKAHNLYLELWADLGLVAGSVPLVIITALGLIMGIRLSLGRGSWSAKTAALATIAIGAAHSLLDFSLQIQAVTLLFVTVVAMGLASGNARPRR